MSKPFDSINSNSNFKRLAMFPINFFEKNDKKRGCISGIIGLILVIFAGNVAILLA